MIQLTPEQLTVVRQYAALLDTIEEGFHYVIESFTNYERTQGDVVLADIFTAFGQIDRANERSLAHFFADDVALLNDIQRFSSVVEEAWKLDGKLHDPNEKQKIIEKHVAPAFEAWKVSMMQHLRPYVEQ
ncbi:hypothetical protein NOW01_05775 [Anoxybacillus salavatliensis]|uniref:hypothetical protein n=1 Tax=Anoxybacillus gonensis TaxID=198467 RepID=UPI0002BFED92|nr:hypothetical protein [Anoxybacillus gonensis]EMI09484.1 hypothetical protein F510_2391 [Anoxybacillus gonensis]MCQ5364515.1 hypothetical protein [Anoxybacillus gonensis]